MRAAILQDIHGMFEVSHAVNGQVLSQCQVPQRYSTEVRAVLVQASDSPHLVRRNVARSSGYG